MATRTDRPPRRVATISLPDDLYRDAVRLARRKGLSRSELFREALAVYRRLEDDWEILLDEARRAARRTGIRTEEDVENLIDEIRG